MTYTYTIYDGDPNVSGPCEWPSHDGVEIEAATVADALDQAEAVALDQAKQNGCYAAGDRLWVCVDDDGDVSKRVIVVE